MYNKDNLIKWYMSKDLINVFKQLNHTAHNTLVNTSTLSFDQYKTLCQNFFDLMPFCNITSNDYTITFENSGTDFIKQIFLNETDNETLIISTKHEHNSVVNELEKCQHTYLLDYTTDILCVEKTISFLSKIIKNYKKVFVYIIGTQISTGQITSQYFLFKLKELLVKQKISHKILLDDVHGMFMHPRDYSLFDYILYTAHAIIPQYNLGLLISKEGKYGKKAFDIGREYYELLKELLKNKQDLFLFKSILTEYFSEFLQYSCCDLYTNSVNHIFALYLKNIIFEKDVYDELDNYGIVIPEKQTNENFIRIRFQEFLVQEPQHAIEGLNLINTLLKRAILMAKLKGEVE